MSLTDTKLTQYEEALAEVSFGDWLKRRRMGLGLTQDQLSLQINCSTSALRKFESEQRRPSAEIIEQLANIFDIPQEERKSFLSFARGDWQAFSVRDTENAPWRSTNVDQQSNLPSLLTTYIGREKEQWEVINLVKKNRLVTLAGTGGIGKTRLAIQVGHQLLPDYPHGIWFIPLDSLTNPLRVPQTVASVFGIREGIDSLVIDTLKNVLRPKTSLLILDNCEHLLDACAQVIKTLLAHCPNLRILTTSREILNLEGEATFYLPSLSTPELSDSLENITEYETIKLFVDRALLALSTFQLTKENAKDIADICRRVDGIPLAIELIAARLNILKVEEIAKQLRESFAILANKSRTTHFRHWTLQASIDWSWSLLTDAEQAFMRQLSVFAGGWTLESAHFVCEGDALSLTNSLAQKSLIVVDQESEYVTRYHFHETLRHYVYERLVESGELGAIRTRHLKYFQKLSEKIESGLRGNKQEEWFARAVDERDNLFAALEQAAEKDIEAGLYISSRLEAAWEKYDLRAGTFWLAEFLGRPESKQYYHARAKALCSQSSHLIWIGEISQARGAAEESLALFRACDDRLGEIDALILLGTNCALTGDQAGGIKLYEQALSLSQSIGDTWRQARVYYYLGWDDHLDYQRTFAHWEKGAVLFNKAGDYRSQVNVLGLIAVYRALNGDIELAQKYLDEAAMVFPLDQKSDRNDYLIAKSIIVLEQGDFDQARTFLQEALVRSEKSGNRYDYLWIQVRCGYLALREGNISEARKLFENSSVRFQKFKETIGVVFALEGMAGIFVAIGEPIKAARLIGLGDATRNKINDTRPLLEQRDLDKVIATCKSKIGEPAFAEAYDEGQAMTLEEAVMLALNEQ